MCRRREIFCDNNLSPEVLITDNSMSAKRELLRQQLLVMIVANTSTNNCSIFYLIYQKSFPIAIHTNVSKHAFKRLINIHRNLKANQISIHINVSKHSASITIHNIKFFKTLINIPRILHTKRSSYKASSCVDQSFQCPHDQKRSACRSRHSPVRKNIKTATIHNVIRK